MKKIIKLWNSLLKSLIIHDEKNEDYFLENELNKEIENNSIKLLNKRLSKNLSVSKKTKELVINKIVDSFVNKRTVDYFDEYLMNNYKKIGISANDLITTIISDTKYNTDEIKNIMHEVEFFGDIHRYLKRDKGSLLIITPEMVTKETDTDEYKNIIRELCSTFNMGNYLPFKYEIDVAELKIEKTSEYKGLIKNNEFIKYIENKTTLNYAAKQSFLSYNENEYKKEKWFLNLTRSLLKESDISSYETMMKYLNSKNENERRLAVLLCVVGSYQILKDVTLDDIEKLSENVLAPYYLKFLNKFYSTSKYLYDNPQALEALKEKSQSFADMENPIFVAINDINNEKIKEMVIEIVSDLRSLEKKNSEAKNFVLHVNDLLKEILDDFITLRYITGKDDDIYLTEEIFKIREYIDRSVKNTMKDSIKDLQLNQKIMKTQMKKGM